MPQKIIFDTHHKNIPIRAYRAEGETLGYPDSPPTISWTSPLGKPRFSRKNLDRENEIWDDLSPNLLERKTIAFAKFFGFVNTGKKVTQELKDRVVERWKLETRNKNALCYTALLFALKINNTPYKYKEFIHPEKKEVYKILTVLTKKHVLNESGEKLTQDEIDKKLDKTLKDAELCCLGAVWNIKTTNASFGPYIGPNIITKSSQILTPARKFIESLCRKKNWEFMVETKQGGKLKYDKKKDAQIGLAFIGKNKAKIIENKENSIDRR